MTGLRSGNQSEANPSYREYRPDDRLSDGHMTALRHVVDELLRYRSHIKVMFSQEFRNSYRGTRLGVFWNFALPLLPISIYVMLAGLRVLPNFEGIPAAVAISCNVAIWFLLADCVRTPISVVQRRNAEAMKTSLPLSAAVASSFARSVFETLVRLALVAVVAAAVSATPFLAGALALPIVACGCLLFLAFGLFLAILNIVTPDIERVVSVVLQYGIFLSGVIFPLAAAGPLAILQVVNPFAVFIGGVSHALFAGKVLHPYALLFWSALGPIAFVIAARLFYVMEQRIRGVV